MNNINDIYKEFGQKFCLCPFLGSFYVTNQIVKENQTASNVLMPCALFRPDNNFKVDSKNMLQSLNNPEWIELRKQFVEGNFHQIKNCNLCIESEAQGGDSPRIGSAKHFVEHATSDLIKEVREIINNNFRVNKIISLDYFPSNYCNYSCIMCSSGASSQRLAFEIKVYNSSGKVVLNSPDDDFFDLLRNVEIINFTGGETVLQKQVLDLIDYLIQEDLAKNITIFLLANGSSFPEDLESKFKKFRRVVYMVSIDGVGPVSEYQRRNSDWNIVNQNAQKLIHHDFISTVINYVMTAANALDFMSFADWLYNNSVEFVALSNVFQPHLSVGVFPAELKELCLSRIDAGIERYSAGTTKAHIDTLRYIKQARTMIEQTATCPELLPRFIKHIRKEDSVSKRTLAEVVPEWAPYFEVDH